jgi:hypothetical protein
MLRGAMSYGRSWLQSFTRNNPIRLTGTLCEARECAAGWTVQMAPIASDPLKPEFYVYRLCGDGVPFYVGIGRAKRAPDRVRYVKYMLGRRASGKPVRWNFSKAVIAELIEARCAVSVEYVSEGLTRSAALQRETKDIQELLAQGRLLANSQQNPRRAETSGQVTAYVLSARPSSR